MSDKKIVYYSEFGAVGDGVHEDFPAIVKCHEYANANGCKVMADPGATYYICETGGVRAIVQTDVDWGDATFILDDIKIPVPSPSRTADIFAVTSTYERKVYGEDSDIVQKLNANGGMRADDTNVGYAPGYPAMLVVFDNTHSAYIRYGVHATGKPNPQRELVTVDAEGNIDPGAKFLLDTNHVSVIWEYRIDDKPIVIENGTFITRSNCAPPVYTAYARGISFERSNVTIRNTVHKITDEGDTGAPYAGFIYARNINNLRCEHLTLQSHKSYKDYNPDGTVHSTMGTYDIGGSIATNVCFYDCHQSNFYKDPERKTVYGYSERWGIMGTNYCKNLIYDNCTLSRLDAHAGVYNVVIKDTKITYISLTGGGTALIEGSTVIAPEGTNNSLFSLRGDYGSTWHGDVIIKDTTYVNNFPEPIYLCSSAWVNWNFGYKTYVPNVLIDNLTIAVPGPKVHMFGEFTTNLDNHIDEPILASGKENLNPMDVNATITVRNNKNGYNFISSSNPYVNSKIKLVVE